MNSAERNVLVLDVLRDIADPRPPSASVREIMATTGLTRDQVWLALEQLGNEGLVIPAAGVGRWTLAPPMPWPLHWTRDDCTVYQDEQGRVHWEIA